jgi:hypothetical protein
MCVSRVGVVADLFIREVRVFLDVILNVDAIVTHRATRLSIVILRLLVRKTHA